MEGVAREPPVDDSEHVSLDAPAPRVLVVAPLYHTDRGGLGRQAVLLTEHLAGLGARPLVATRRMTGLPERLFADAVEVVQISAGRPDVHNYERKSPLNLLTSLRFSVGLLQTMRRRRGSYELIHFHGASLPLLVALPWAKLLGKRVVAKVASTHQGVEAGDFRNNYGPLGRLMAWTLGHVDAYVATTAEISEALQGEGYGLEQVERVPNFVDTGRFRPPTEGERAVARASLGLEEGRVAILCSGRLVPRKNADVLIRAFESVRKTCAAEAPQLLFLGDGPERAHLEALARSLGAGDAVRFLGFHSDPWRFLHAVDVFTIPSQSEGLPNSLLEAMASGLPVVASRIGGALEAFGETAPGLLVPPGEVAPLADALTKLVLEPDLRAAMGGAGAKRIADAFALESVAPRYLQLYRRVLGS
jgi:glycosyltransferase involved in cell wall biosynthesis